MERIFEFLARCGYGARGVVYGLLGVLALMGVAAGGETDNGPKGALSTLLGQPFGRLLLAGIALGLVGHVLWRLAQALLNADHQKDNARGYLVRTGNLVSGLANLSLAIAAGSLAIGAGGGSDDGQQGVARWLMQLPFGLQLLGLAGAALSVAGLVQIWRGVSGKYGKRIELPHRSGGLLPTICVLGLTARGTLLAISGGFLIYAAITLDPEKSGGLAAGLDWIRQLPFGGYLYALAALGLIAFGLYSFIEARYRQVDSPDVSDLKSA